MSEGKEILMKIQQHIAYHTLKRKHTIVTRQCECSTNNCDCMYEIKTLD